MSIFSVHCNDEAFVPFKKPDHSVFDIISALMTWQGYQARPNQKQEYEHQKTLGETTWLETFVIGKLWLGCHQTVSNL